VCFPLQELTIAHSKVAEYEQLLGEADQQLAVQQSRIREVEEALEHQKRNSA
jgi:hypothetical protein